jgi:glycosyltransferase involved in cell wall biosynthesis
LTAAVQHQKKAIVLGVHSFLDNHVKVGIQFIAEGLAKSGWQVDYVSIFSSPLDLYGAQRRRRLRRVWVDRQDENGKVIAPGLTEYAFRAPCPAHRRFLRYGWQEKLFDALAPAWLRGRHYDVCIHDVTANVLYLKWINADHTILRLNDLPEGFSHSLSGQIIARIRQNIRSKKYAEIWSAHEPLTCYALRINPSSRAFTICNGVDDTFLNANPACLRKTKTAVFIGNIETRIDLELVDKTAALMKDWQFDIIGPLNCAWSVQSSNVRRLPPISRPMVIEALAGYQVGLIPFRDIGGGIAFLERPLKFFEYIGAGLGVASTDVGALRSGMGQWASYGNTPETFADAVRREALRASERSRRDCLEMIEPYAWSAIIQQITHRLEGLGHA